MPPEPGSARRPDIVGAVLVVALLVPLAAASVGLTGDDAKTATIALAWREPPDPASRLPWLIATLGAVASPRLLVAITTLVTAAGLAATGAALTRRGWPPVAAGLAVLPWALHPLVRHLAATGDPFVLAIPAAAITVLASAGQGIAALAGIGIGLVGLVLTDRDAVFWALPILPLAGIAIARGERRAARTALVLLPPLATLAALSLSGDLTMGERLARWSAPLHGAIWDDAAAVLPPAADVAAISFLRCVTAFPPTALLAMTIFGTRRIGIGLVVLLAPAVAATAASVFWQGIADAHVDAIAIGIGLATSAAWSSPTRPMIALWLLLLALAFA